MRFVHLSSSLVVLTLLALGCGDGGSASDSGTDSSVADSGVDSNVTDSGPADSNIPDTSTLADSSTADSGAPDAMTDAAADTGADAGDPGTCSAGSPCTGGALCVGGPACSDAWSCILSDRACTDDLVPYCGCDGVTFMDSSTCITQPVAHLGSCEAGANCDRRAVMCRRVEPTCPDGQVAEVLGSCWSERCLPIGECGCRSGAECPMNDLYTCHGTTERCGPYL